MRRNVIVAMMAGAMLSVAATPQLAEAQGRGQAKQEQRAQSSRQAEQAREQAVREAERERLRQQRDVRARQDAAEMRRREAERERLRRQRDRDGWDDRAVDRRDDRGWSEYPQQRRNEKAGGPSFCRSGEGHPVFGRQWCRDKGFGLGSGRDLPIRWDDIVLRDRNGSRNQQLGRSVLGDILGSVVLGRFESYGRQYGSGAINGRWLQDGGAMVLQLNMGNTPIARLLDRDGNGRVDSVLLRN